MPKTNKKTTFDMRTTSLHKNFPQGQIVVKVYAIKNIDMKLICNFRLDTGHRRLGFKT